MKKTYDIKTIAVVIGLAITLLTCVMSFAKSYYLIPAEVERLKEEVKELKGTKTSIAELKTEVRYIREDTKEILEYLRQKRDGGE